MFFPYFHFGFQNRFGLKISRSAPYWEEFWFFWFISSFTFRHLLWWSSRAASRTSELSSWCWTGRLEALSGRSTLRFLRWNPQNSRWLDLHSEPRMSRWPCRRRQDSLTVEALMTYTLCLCCVFYFVKESFSSLKSDLKMDVLLVLWLILLLSHWFDCVWKNMSH